MIVVRAPKGQVRTSAAAGLGAGIVLFVIYVALGIDALDVPPITGLGIDPAVSLQLVGLVVGTLYGVLLILLVLESLETFFAGRGLGLPEKASYWTGYALAAWVPIYLVASLRRVYQQNWFLTLAKGFLIGLSYLTLLVFVTTVVALLGFVLV